VNKLNDDGSCGSVSTDNGCQVFCELRRRGLLGHETRASGKSGNQQPASTVVTFEDGLEISISNGFSIGVDGVFKDAIGAGLGYTCE
jgi:hypothetical protein